MNHYLLKPETPGELLHFGIKGMKWGKHKNKYANDPHNRNYSMDNRAADRKVFGANAENRINRRLNNGKSYKIAVAKEVGIAVAKRAAVGSIAATLALLEIHGKSPMVAIAKKAETNRGRAAAAAAMGIPMKGSSTPYAKQRRGAYNITSV